MYGLFILQVSRKYLYFFKGQLKGDLLFRGYYVTVLLVKLAWSQIGLYVAHEVNCIWQPCLKG